MLGRPAVPRTAEDSWRRGVLLLDITVYIPVELLGQTLFSRKEKKESGRGVAFSCRSHTRFSEHLSRSLLTFSEGQVREKKSYFFSEDGGSPENGVPAEGGASGARTYTPTRTRI